MTRSGATTNIGQLNSTLNIGGSFTQEAGSTFEITLGASPDIVAGSASLSGTLILHGFTAGAVPVTASQVQADSYTMIHTTGGITGNFDNINLPTSGLDYLITSGSVSGNGLDYNLGFELAWTQGGALLGTGSFTLGAGTAFDVDIPLNDQTVPGGGFVSGWDGRSLTKNGGGLLILSAVNGYTGATTVNGGVLQMGIADAFAASSDLILNGGVLDLDGFNQLGRRLTGSGGILLNGGVLTVDNATLVDATLYSGVIADGSVTGGGFAKTGLGTLTLTGDSTYAGPTTIGGGTLQLGDGGLSGSVAGDIVNNGTLVVDRSNAVTLGGTLSGAGAFIQAGTGLTTLSGSGSSQGSVEVQHGTLAFLQTGDFSVAGNYVTRSGATTNIGQLNSTLNIGGSFTQEAGSTFEITLGASPDIVAGSASLSGTLILHGFTAGAVPVTASQVQADSYTMIHTTGGITGNFDNINLPTSGLDYLITSGSVSGNGLDYNLGFELAWTQGGALLGTGSFTLGAGTAFDVDIPLNDQTVPVGGFVSGWDGRSLTKNGEGLLILSAVNDYTGSTEVVAGELRAGVANAFSANSAHTVMTGATLSLNSFNQRIASLSNAGTVNLSASATSLPGTILTVAGAYISNGGTLHMNTELGDDLSRTDRLVAGSVILGAGGATVIQVTNVDGLGGRTIGNGIELVHVTGGAAVSDAGAFVLGGRVAAGAYEYQLYQNGPTGANGNWYLRTALGPGPDPEIPAYRPEIPVAMASPALVSRFGLTMLGSCDDRSLVSSTDSKVASCGDVNPGQSAWARTFGATGDVGFGGNNVAERVTSFEKNGPSYDFTLGGFQAGQDLLKSETAAGSRNVVGFYVGAGTSSARVDLAQGGSRAGTTSLSGYSLGTYWTHQNAMGWYLDAVVQNTWYSGVSARSQGDQPQALKSDGWGFLGSIESGYPITVGSGWSVVPQAQLIYQHIALGDGSDAFGTTHYQASDSVYGRLGARLNRDWTTAGNQVFSTWIRANVWYSFGAEAKTTFNSLDGLNPVTLNTVLGGSWAQFGLGVSGKLSENVSIFAGGDYNFTIDQGTGSSLSGILGLTVNW